jgi:hypothetical protein
MHKKYLLLYTFITSTSPPPTADCNTYYDFALLNINSVFAKSKKIKMKEEGVQRITSKVPR